ncbi:N-acetylglucosamine-6-phosphate deacetylase [Paenibacillus whitsoniae]|uniref:N-acetylglucosamine-6-phosphate deacetylase n=1 Tax=Paenibacillus whitsoniae TaxID=2496558 RepID=A0A430JJY0_9BACL|nr:N-acetylglucosamine-6-phosphate deacetylase [Paenibacillus whitsoniae]RTE11296.1 N-acetylglucosamine-6-phosphate deacetylase [Paenibacillus whitsoniae]
MSGQLELSGLDYRTGEPLRIVVEDGCISAIAPGSLSSPACEAGLYVGPGLVDLQINGYGGDDFNTLLGDGGEFPLERIARRLAARGCTTFYPTVITNGDEELCELLAAIDRACRLHPEWAGFIGGIHLEGPFISPEDGARGAHPLEHVTAPEWAKLQRWQEASGGRIRLLTMSPEWPGSDSFIARCAAAGLVVSIGHTSATPEQIRAAAAAGARMSTHLGNGAHRMLPRHPNYLWEQLALDELSCGLIADGFHLPDQVLKVIMKVKEDWAFLVSDAVSLAGMAPGRYETHIGGCVVLTPNGRLHMESNEDLLAGSVTLLPDAVSHLTERGLVDFGTAWDMASLRPALQMGLPAAQGLSVGAPADLATFRRAGTRIELQQVVKAGRLVSK